MRLDGVFFFDMKNFFSDFALTVAMVVAVVVVVAVAVVVVVVVAVVVLVVAVVAVVGFVGAHPLQVLKHWALIYGTSQKPASMYF